MTNAAILPGIYTYKALDGAFLRFIAKADNL